MRAGHVRQPRRQVDRIAVAVLVQLDDGATGQAHLQAQAQSLGYLAQGFGVVLLHVHGRADGQDAGGKLQQHPIAQKFDDLPAVRLAHAPHPARDLGDHARHQLVAEGLIGSRAAGEINEQNRRVHAHG